MFWDQLHLAVPTGGCHLPGKPKEPVSARPGPDLAPTAWEGLDMPSSCLHTKKEQIQPFILTHGALGRVAGVDLPLQATGPDQQTPLLQCPVLSMGATNSHRLVLPKKPPGTWVVSLSRAGAEPKSHHCHQGEKNPAVRTSETKKDASLGCFFSIRFFFFYEKRSHGVLQQTECQKNCFKQNINKTKQKDKNLALLSSRLSEISLCSIEGSGF